MSWLDDILKATREFESPPKFFYWSALAALSAITKRNVYLRKKSGKSTAYTLYPNIYVFLVAKSGLRKGVPIKMARKLVTEVDNTRLIVGRSSIQGILKELDTTYTTQTGKIRDDAAFFLCASEFRSSLIGDPDALVTLTDLYDGDFTGDWQYLLKNAEGTSGKLKDIYAVLLGGSNPTHLKEKISKSDIDGGFIGRSYIIFADKKGKLNPLTDDVYDENEDQELDEVEALNYKELAKHLIEVSKIKGRFRFHPEAKDYYDDWYIKLNNAEFEDRTGTLDRLHDHVLKVAMLLSLTKNQTLILNKDDIEDAVEACNELAGNVNRAMLPSGSSAFADQTATILQELLNTPGHELSRRRILQKFWGDLDAFDLDRIKETLIQKDAVDIRRCGKDEFYKLKRWVVEKYLNFAKETED